MPTTIGMTVNGRAETVRTEPDRSLLDVLREDLGLTGTKYACGEGACHACAVLIDGQSTISCMTRVDAVAGKAITTIEGLADGDSLNPVQQAFVDELSPQCGFCFGKKIVGFHINLFLLLRVQLSPQPNEPCKSGIDTPT